MNMNGVSSLFSSMNGSYNAAADFSSIISQRSQIQNGSYGKLMKAYVNKVGNKTALNAYRNTGTTASASDVMTTKNTSEKTKKKGFLDTHLSNIGKSGSSSSTASEKVNTTSSSATKARSGTSTTTKKTGFLDNHLSSIGKSKTSSTTASGKSYLDSYLKENASEEMNGVAKAKAYAEAATGRKLNDDGTTSVIDTTL